MTLRLAHPPMARIISADESMEVLEHLAPEPVVAEPVAPAFALRTQYKADVVVLSDVHLGSEVSRAKLLRKALQEWYPFRRLIILGDLFDDLNFSRLKKHHFGLIDDLRRLTNPKRGVTVDWVEGNHDLHAHEIIRRVIGANVHSEILLTLHGKRYLFMHGHQFDRFLNEHPIISTLAGNVYEAVQKREGQNQALSRWLKKKSKGWLKICRKVENAALRHANDRNVDFILCGHTHYHDATQHQQQQKIKYVNTGCWTDTPCTLTTIGPDGLRKHLYF